MPYPTTLGAVLHDKMDELAEAEAANATDIVWLEWAVRVLFATSVGVGGVAFKAIL